MAQKLALKGKCILNANETLNEKQFLTSSNGSYFATIQTDGNFVLYVSSQFHHSHSKWSTKTDGKSTGPYKLVMQNDNNLVIYDGWNEAIWASDTYKKGKPGARLVLQDDRNLVIYDGDNKAIWASDTCV